MTPKRIHVSGKPKNEINADLLMQAILLIAEQKLLVLQQAGCDEDKAERDQRESA